MANLYDISKITLTEEDKQNLKYPEDITAFVFANPADGNEYTVWGAGTFADDNLTDPEAEDYTNVELIKANVAKAFDFVATDKTIVLKADTVASIDYAIENEDDISIIFGAPEFHFASKVI